MAAPGVPTISVKQGGRGVVVLRISHTPTATSYKVYRDTAADPTALEDTVTPASAAAWYFYQSIVTPGTRYWFRVKASGDGDSAYSDNADILAASYTATDPAPTGALKIARSAG